MYLFSMCILIFLAVIGLCAICVRISQALHQKGRRELLLLEPIQGHCEDAEFILRNAVRRAMSSGTGCSVLCVDAGMDRETRKVCELVSLDYPILSVCTMSEALNIVKNL